MTPMLRRFAIIDGRDYWLCDGCGKLILRFDTSAHHCNMAIDWGVVQKRLWDKLHASVDGPANGGRLEQVGDAGAV